MVKIQRHYYLVAAVIFAAAVVYGSVCGHEFIAYDDEINIYANRYVTNGSLTNLLYFWTGLYHNLYIPLVYDLWLVLAKISGLFNASSATTLNPLLFHSVNLLLHLGSTVLVFLIIRVLLEDDWAAAGGALLFAVHPVQVEAVSWATGMKDVLSGMLGLLAIWQYILYAKVTDDQRKKIFHYVLAGLAFIAAILSKPGAVAIPAALALIALLLISRPPKVIFRELAPWLLAVIPVLLITKFAQPATSQIFIPTAWQRLLVAGDAWTFYFTKLLWPWRLGPDYGRTPQMVLTQGWQIWLSGLAPYLILILLFWRGNRFCRAAVGFSLVMLLPVSGLVSFDFQEYSTVADRYLYTAMLGPSLLLGWLLRRYYSQRGLVFGGAGIFFLLGVCSLLQVRNWQNGGTFYQNALEVNPHSWLAANNLGVIYLDRHELPEAKQLFEQSIAANPDYAIAVNNLGTVLGMQGQFDLAQEQFSRALTINPNYADAAANLGDIYLLKRDVVRAREYYQRALDLKPDFAHVHAALGDISSGAHQLTESLAHYQLALDYGPPSVKLLNNMGLVYKDLERGEDAAECYRRALLLAPDSPEAHNNLGLVYFEAGHYREAIDQFKQAGELSPDQPQPFCNLGKALLANGQAESAQASFLKALSLNPGFAPAMSGLALLYRSVGRNDLAADYDQRAKALGYFGEGTPHAMLSR